MADSLFGRASDAFKAAIGVFSNADQRRTWNLLGGVLPGGLGMPPQRYTKDFLRAYSQMPWLRAAANKIAISCAQIEWKMYSTAVRDPLKPGEEEMEEGGKPNPFDRERPGKPGKPGERPVRLRDRDEDEEEEEQRKPSGKRLIYTRDRKLQRGDFTSRKARIKALKETEELQEIEEHPLLEVLHNANSFQTGLQMRKVTQLHIDLVGEAFWLKERDGMGTVVAVWPIPPDWILNTPTPSAPFFRVGFRAWRGMIPDTEFIWFQDTDPSNPYARGSGIGQSIGDELETDEYTAKHAKAFFYNRAKPDLLIFPKTGNIREPDIKRLETDWMQSNQGFWRAFKPYFMTREVGVHEMDQNFRAMQLVQLREFERDVIIQTFGIPPEMLGILSNSNRATIDAAAYLMGRYIVQPRLEFMRTILQEKFVPEFDERLIIDYESPVDADLDSASRAAAQASWALTVNEWRIQAGQEPLPGDEGQLHGVPQGISLTTLEDAIRRAEEAHEAEMERQANPFGGFGGPPGAEGSPFGGGAPGGFPPKPGKPGKPGEDEEEAEVAADEEESDEGKKKPPKPFPPKKGDGAWVHI